MCWFVFFFFSSRRRHTRCALVTGVQTCALPICPRHAVDRLTRMLRLAVADDCDQLIEQILAIFPLTQMGLSIDMPNFACIGAMGAPEFGQSMSAAEINERIVAACSYHGGRSAENTSELQSLMRITYPVYTLIKK